MKTINVTFEDEEFKSLKRAKGKTSWQKFIMKAAT
jgi:predicted CopG family antitoxin